MARKAARSSAADPETGWSASPIIAEKLTTRLLLLTGAIRATPELLSHHGYA